MRNKYFWYWILLLPVLMTSCYFPKYLSYVENLRENCHGSYIRIVRPGSTSVSGELIAIDSQFVFLIQKDSNKLIQYPMKDVKKYFLYFARPRDYSWMIPIGVGLPLLPFKDPDPQVRGIMPFHGFFSMLTIPINLISSFTVIGVENASVHYTEKQLPKNKLYMFSRFPQGIPAGLDKSKLK